VLQVRACDRGVGAYCALQLVIVDPRYRSSDDLVHSEYHHLQKLGWSIANGDTGEQSAANSPGHKLRVTYASAAVDLRGIDLGWIQRPRSITLALSRTLFDRASAMSMMLEIGSS
jgi:hypothetical protein